MPKVPPTSAILENAGIGAFFRAGDVAPLGVTYHAIQRLVREGEVEVVGRGLYRLARAEVTELETVAMVARAVPHAIVCLLTALHIHGIGTQLSREVWVALARGARKPKHLPTSVRIVRFSGQMLTYGVTTQVMQGVNVRITTPARTVVDCFRYRNKIGLDVAMEALRDAVHRRKIPIGEIERAAEVCRIRTVMDPYFAALSA